MSHDNQKPMIMNKTEAGQESPIIVEKVIQSSPEKVWQALTDKNHMKEWYFDLEEFKAEPGFEFRFSGEGNTGQKYIHICRVTEVIPQQKLQYSWLYENQPGESLVTFELSQINEATKIKLTHSGIHTFPKDNPDMAKESFSAGWNEIIGNLLPHYLEK